ncbi:MAG TPA: DUF5666 domain-containing protein [Acetobacteraceae bacterium]|nr:DUF5666 domain-containing protein [Acetobacteraceae bacterium]
MTRLPARLLAASAALLATTALAAPIHERVRGTVATISGGTITVHTPSGKDVPVALTGSTHYAEVLKSSLDKIAPGSYIGTAAKSIGGSDLVALEVVVFPPAMRGVGEGHYAWDRIRDTTLSGGAATASTMTNGTVTTAAPAGGGKDVNSTMTNGTVSTASTSGGAKQITVTYKGGKQVIIVPPTAPIVTFQPASLSDLTPGKTVFVNGLSDDGKVTAVSIAIGTKGANPPM